jgi:RES domain-containing protein
MGGRRVRDSRLLDAIEGLPVESYEGVAWRVVGDGRDPLQCSAAGGRWDDRSFEVLYTSMAADGAMAEMYFHLSRGQPVMPSLREYRLFELEVRLDECVRVASLEELGALGLATGAFGKLSYAEREKEYPRTQDIAEAAHFHDRRGMIVPSARREHPNLLVFCERAGPDAVTVARDHGLVSWADWKKKPLGF